MSGPGRGDVTVSWGESAPPAVYDTPFIGRNLERAHLETAIGQAVAGEPVFLALTGEAGVGKTRLLHHALEASGLPAHWARCSPTHEQPPYWPVTQLLRSIRFRLGAEAYRASIGQLNLDGDDPLSLPMPAAAARTARPNDVDRFRLFDRVLSAIESFARSEPLLLVIDDAQWADASTLRLFDFLAQSLTAGPIGVLVTLRTDELERDEDGAAARELLTGMTSIRLGRLTRAHSGELLAGLAGRPVDPGYLDAAYEATAGNPFFLTEWARAVSPDSGGLDARLSSIAGLPLERLAAMAPDRRDLVDVAAVLGESFDLDLLAAATGREVSDVLDALGDAVAVGVISPRGRREFGFVHGLVRDAVYEEMSTTVRARHHAAIARTLSGEPVLSQGPEVLARHLREGNEPDGDEAAIDLLVDAARGAEESQARDVAVARYRDALSLLDALAEPAPQRSARVRLALAKAHLALAQPDEARRVLRRAAEEARNLGDTDLLAEVALAFPPGFEGVAMAPAFDQEQISIRREALSHLPDADTPRRAELLGALAAASYWSRHLEGRPETFGETLAEQEMLSAEALDMARRVADPRTIARCVEFRLNAVWSPDHLDERPALVAELFELATRLDDLDLLASALGWQILESMDAGRLREAEERVGAYSALADRLGQPLYRRSANQWRASIQMLRGDIDGGIQAAFGALSEAAALIGDENAVTEVAMLMSVQRFFTGDYEPLIEPARHVIASNERTSLNWQCGLAFMLAESGQLDEARTLFEELVDSSHSRLPRDINWLVCTQLLALTAAILGDRDRGQGIYDALLPLKERDAIHGWGYASYGPVAWALGELAMLLGDFPGAIRHLTHATELREVGPYRSVAELRLAQAYARDESSAKDHNGALARLPARFRAWHMDRFAAEAEELSMNGGEVGKDTGSYSVRRADDGWLFETPDGEFTTTDQRGMHYLAELMRRPGESFAALDLLRLATGGGPALAAHEPGIGSAGAGLGAIVDETARRAYTARIEELRRVIARGERRGERLRLERAETEIGQLEAEIRRISRPGGTLRSSVGDEEKARVSVTKAIRRTITRLFDDAPPVARHLEEVVQTGSRCSYGPHSAALDWIVTT